jgi:transcriptional regulator GlxA family with amidase domain
MRGTSLCRENRRVATTSRERVVDRIEAYARAHRGAPVPFSKLCRMVGLSERGLRAAFYSVRGKSPQRCILAERLQSVRRALSDAGTKGETVTSIATSHGFYELGRFAGTYREAFGEAPSETLRRTVGKLTNEGTWRARKERRCLQEQGPEQPATGIASPG